MFARARAPVEAYIGFLAPRAQDEESERERLHRDTGGNSRGAARGLCTVLTEDIAATRELSARKTDLPARVRVMAVGSFYFGK